MQAGVVRQTCLAGRKLREDWCQDGWSHHVRRSDSIQVGMFRNRKSNAFLMDSDTGCSVGSQLEPRSVARVGSTQHGFVRVLLSFSMNV